MANIETANASKFHCPHCKGKRLQVATNTEFGTFTNVTGKKVTTAVLSESTRYWVCQDCGNTFPFPQDVKAQAYACAESVKPRKVLAIILAICAGFMFLAASIIPFLAFLGVLGLLEAAGCYWWSSSGQEKAEKLYAEYDELLSKCTD